MKRWLHRSLIAALVLATLAGSVVMLATHQADAKMRRHVDVPAHPIVLRTDTPSIERGRYLFNSRGCTDCHGANGQGRTFINDGKGMLVAGPNISPGPGNVVSHYLAEDWERTIRHGVKPNGRPLMIMPAEDYNRLTDDDLASLVAYVRQLPPVAGQGAVLQLPTPVKALYGLGLINDAAATIDHSLPPQQPVPEGVTAEHGRYVASMCMGCHGARLAGGKIPGAPPDWPAAAKLTPGQGSAMPRYVNAQAFVAMLRSGLRPDGSAVSKVMPFEAIKHLNDTDARALYAYLGSLEAAP
jgi:mono/diheme cytochrome c family protein